MAGKEYFEKIFSISKMDRQRIFKADRARDNFIDRVAGQWSRLTQSVVGRAGQHCRKIATELEYSL